MKYLVLLGGEPNRLSLNLGFGKLTRYGSGTKRVTWPSHVRAKTTNRNNEQNVAIQAAKDIGFVSFPPALRGRSWESTRQTPMPFSTSQPRP